MGKGKKKTKVKVIYYKSDAGDISVYIGFGAKYRVEVTEYASSRINGHGGVFYFDDDEKLKKYLKKVNAEYIDDGYVNVDFNQ
ncbi:MAG: hypothetical protein ABFD25_04320 [Clostridiaceae bacterium]